MNTSRSTLFRTFAILFLISATYNSHHKLGILLSLYSNPAQVYYRPSQNKMLANDTPMFHPDSLVTLLVGPEEEKMVVHESYLSQDSAFFKAALKKQWTEGQARVIKLP
jgi:hypothetical protein